MADKYVKGAGSSGKRTDTAARCALPPVRTAVSKAQGLTSAAADVGEGHPRARLVGWEVGAATVESSVEGPQKTENRTAIGPLCSDPQSHTVSNPQTQRVRLAPERLCSRPACDLLSTSPHFPLSMHRSLWGPSRFPRYHPCLPGPLSPHLTVTDSGFPLSGSPLLLLTLLLSWPSCL